MNDENVKINDGKSLKTLINEVIKESVKSALYQKSLQEKEKQDAVASAGNNDASSAEDLFGDSGNDEQPSGDQNADQSGETSKTGDDEAEKMKKGDVDASDVVEKLNAIRSGKSFKDETIKKNMEQYVNSLKTPERVALFSFLKGIAQITTGEIEAQSATDPESRPADVQMKKGEDVQTKHIKPNVIKGAAPVKHANKAPAEDTSGPVPITPKKR